MRLYKFETATETILLPPYNASTQPINRSVRLKIARTSNGLVVDQNSGNVEAESYLTHTGVFIFTNSATMMGNLRQWEIEVGNPGTLTRASSEESGGVPVVTEINDTAYLVGMTVSRTTGRQDSTGKALADITFRFFLEDPNDWT